MLALLIILVVMPLMPVIGCPLARRGEAISLAIEVILLNLVVAMVEVGLLTVVLHEASRETVCKAHLLLVSSLLLT
jgi:mannose/fructose/N-acetylgalactosamine-specific phosphotransferase system component IID